MLGKLDAGVNPIRISARGKEQVGGYSTETFVSGMFYFGSGVLWRLRKEKGL